MILVTKVESKHNECTMCTRRTKEDKILSFWKIESEHPQRNMVIILCDVCADELIIGMHD